MSSALARIEARRKEREAEMALRRAQRLEALGKKDESPSDAPSSETSSSPTSTPTPTDAASSEAPSVVPSSTPEPTLSTAAAHTPQKAEATDTITAPSSNAQGDGLEEFMERRRRERDEARRKAQLARQEKEGITAEDLAHEKSATTPPGSTPSAGQAPPEEKKILTAAERRALREQKQKEAAEARSLELKRQNEEREAKLREEQEAVEAAKRLEATYRADRVHKDVAFPQYQALGGDLLFDRTGEPRPELLRDHLAQEGRLHIEAAFALIDKAGKIFYDEPNVLELTAPIVVVGDIHGQFYDLLTLMNEAGPLPATTYLFLGDYVDRGNFSTEVCFYLYALKCKFPRQIYLLRGNHECRAISSHFNFQKECTTKYTMGIWQAFINTFDMLPLAAVITNDDGRYLALHGGIGPKLEVVDNIKELNRYREPLEAGVLVDILWADPEEEDVLEGMTDDEIEDWKSITFDANQARGCSYTFGNAAISQFLRRNNLKCLLRGHSVMQKGYKRHFFGDDSAEPMCITVFSAPNYCSKYQNLGAYARIPSSGDHITTHTVVWTEPPFWLPDFQNCISFSLPTVANTVHGVVEGLLEFLLSEESETSGEHSKKRMVSSVVKKLVQSDQPMLLTPLKAGHYQDNLDKFQAFLKAQQEERGSELRPTNIDFRSLSRTISSPALTMQFQMRDKATEKSLRLQRTATLTVGALKRSVAEANKLIAAEQAGAGPSSSSTTPAPAEAKPEEDWKAQMAQFKALHMATKKAPPTAASVFEAPPAAGAPASTNPTSTPSTSAAPAATASEDNPPPLEPVQSVSQSTKDNLAAIDKKKQKKLAKEEEKKRIEMERLKRQQEKNEERVRRRLEAERLRDEEEERKRKIKEEEEERKRKAKEDEEERKRKIKEEEEERKRKIKEEEEEKKRKIEEAKEEKRRKKAEAERLKLEEEEKKKKEKEEKRVKKDSQKKLPSWRSKFNITDVSKDPAAPAAAGHQPPPHRSASATGLSDLAADAPKQLSTSLSLDQPPSTEVSFSMPVPSPEMIFAEILEAEKSVEIARAAAAEAERLALEAEQRFKEALAILNAKREQYKQFLVPNKALSSGTADDSGSEISTSDTSATESPSIPRRQSSSSSSSSDLDDKAKPFVLPTLVLPESPRGNDPSRILQHSPRSNTLLPSPRHLVPSPRIVSESPESPRSQASPSPRPPISPRAADATVVATPAPSDSTSSVTEPPSISEPSLPAEQPVAVAEPSPTVEQPVSPSSPQVTISPSSSPRDTSTATPEATMATTGSYSSESSSLPGSPADLSRSESTDSTSSFPAQLSTDTFTPTVDSSSSSSSGQTTTPTPVSSVHPETSPSKSPPSSPPKTSLPPTIITSQPAAKASHPPLAAKSKKREDSDDDTDESYDESDDDDDSSEDEANFATKSSQADKEHLLAIQKQQEVVREVQEKYEREAKELKMIVDTLRNPQSDHDDSLLDRLEARLIELKKTHPSSKAAYKIEKEKLAALMSTANLSPLQTLKPMSRSLAHMDQHVERERSATALPSPLKPADAPKSRGPLDLPSDSSRVLVKNLPLSNFSGSDTAKRSAIESAIKAFAGSEAPAASPPSMRRSISHKMQKVDSIDRNIGGSNPSPPAPVSVGPEAEHSRLGKLFRRRSGKSPSSSADKPPEKAAKKERRWSRKAVPATTSQQTGIGASGVTPSASADTVNATKSPIGETPTRAKSHANPKTAR